VDVVAVAVVVVIGVIVVVIIVNCISSYLQLSSLTWKLPRSSLHAQGALPDANEKEFMS
jgi:hypothetical protein